MLHSILLQLMFSVEPPWIFPATLTEPSDDVSLQADLATELCDSSAILNIETHSSRHEQTIECSDKA